MLVEHHFVGILPLQSVRFWHGFATICYLICRQLVASGLLDVLRNAKDSQEREVVLDALNKLAQDEGDGYFFIFALLVFQVCKNYKYIHNEFVDRQLVGEEALSIMEVYNLPI